MALPLRKSPGYDLITAEVLRKLTPNGFTLLTQIYNAILRTSHYPIQWKLSQIVLLLKPGKPPNSASSYRPISLLPVASKVFEKLILPRLQKFAEERRVIPHHQFGFRSQHSTIHQLHRVVDRIASGLESKKYTGSVFLDVSSAFDKVWHDGLLFKLKNILPDGYYLILKSFLEDRFFIVQQCSEVSDYRMIKAGVPQGSCLSPLLYTIFTSDIPETDMTSIATYADDTVLLSSSHVPEDTSMHLQQHLNILCEWLDKWRIQINPAKSIHVSFTLRRGQCPHLFLNNELIPQKNEVRYLGLILDKRLTWRSHIKNKKQQLNFKLKELYRYIGSHSRLPLHLKLQLYKTLFIPVWAYGLQLYGTAKRTNLHLLQAFQSKFLRIITGAPYYVSNHTIHSDLNMQTISTTAESSYRSFYATLGHSRNPLIRNLHVRGLPGNPVRRLKRRWSRDLL
jgi:hypothetical protein